MISSLVYRSIVLMIIICSISACAGLQATANETWTLVQILTSGEHIESNTEIVEVRNCCGIVERKTVSCSAGTSTELDVSMEAEIGIQAGGQIAVEPSVGLELGFNRDSGQSLALDPPPDGHTYLYHITKTYSVIAGEAMVRSSSGEEQTATYRFQATCSLTIEPSIDTFVCEETCSVALASPSPAPSTQEPTSPPITFTPEPTSPYPSQIEMNAFFGAGNWFCFPDRETGVGVKKLTANFSVRPPLRYVDTWLGRFELGDTSSQAAGATAELDIRLPRSECPSFQQEALAAWSSARASDAQPFDRARFDGLFGAGNWECLPDYAFGIRVIYLSAPLTVQYPFTVVDAEDSTRYGVGEIAPGGGRATVWLGGSIPSNQC